MLYDMMNGDFPVQGLGPKSNILPLIKPENITLYIELSQLGNTNDEKLYVHYLKEHSMVSMLMM